ncbi:hypothetical protein Ancab_018289 [Ancistrocladus abbreviatus]
METDENKNQELKHLGFVKMAAIKTLVCLLYLYDYAKQNSGPLKSTVCRVESAVATVVSPVYVKFEGVADDLLTFLDQKVDVVAAEFDEHAPPLAKQVAGKIHSLIYKGCEVAQDLINRAQSDGPKAAAHYAATESKQFMLIESVKLWTKLDQLPPFHMVAAVAVPTAAHWSEKYNRLVSEMSRKGYPLFNYVPLIPVDDIAMAFEQNETSKQGNGAAAATAVAEGN